MQICLKEGHTTDECWHGKNGETRSYSVALLLFALLRKSVCQEWMSVSCESMLKLLASNGKAQFFNKKSKSVN